MRSYALAVPLCALFGLLPSFTQEHSASQPIGPAQQTQPNTTAPSPPFAEQIRKTVGFLMVTYQNGATEGGVIGTCFFVSVPDKRLGENGSFVYLVTNRHVAQPGIDLGTPYQTKAVVIRLNLRSSVGETQSVQEQIFLSNGLHWYFPSDDAVDLAVLPLLPDQIRYDYMAIPSTMIAGAAQFKNGDVGVGDPISFAGYFSNFPGQIRMEPIVRGGVIAMVPQEKLDTTLHKPGRLILADLHAFHGNSGSPVFVNTAGMHRGSIIVGREVYALRGCQRVLPESASFSVPAATVLTGEVRDNSGIATIVPAQDLADLLDSPEIRANRDNQLAIINETQSPTR